MRSSITDIICTCCTSLVPRVIREAAENDCTSASENDTTFANRRPRRSRPILAPVVEAIKLTKMATSMPSAASASILPPVSMR